MKKTAVLLITLLFIASSAVASTEKLTSTDWVKITRQRKVYFVLGSMEAFQKRNTVFRHTMNDYIAWLDESAAGKVSADMDLVFSELVAAKERPSAA